MNDSHKKILEKCLAQLAKTLIVDTKSLNPPNNETEVQTNQNLEIEPMSEGPALPFDKPFDIKVKSAISVFKGVGVDGVYQCARDGPRGLVLILNYYEIPNQEPRKGSEIDVSNLSTLFAQLNYKVIEPDSKDLNHSETLKAVEEFRDREEHKKADSTIVVIMSHGKDGPVSEGSHFITSDGKSIGSEIIINYFNNDNCPKLKGKPKLFFFQFCRGDEEDNEIATDGHQSPSVKQKAMDVTRFSDMLIAYSTLPGFVAYRNPNLGSFFVRAICYKFMKHAWKDEVSDLLSKVDLLVRQSAKKRNKKQMFEYTNRGFSKKFFFNPGYVGAHVKR